MKKAFFILLSLFIAGFFLSPGVFSMELEVSGGLGNLAFDKDRVLPLSGEAGAFTPQFFPLINARLSGENSGIGWNTGFERDPLLRSRIFGNVKIERDYFSFEAGPFVGLFNSGELPVNPGISAALGLSVPGIIFVRAEGSSTLTAVMNFEENYFQTIETGGISLGFWVPFVVCSLNLSVKSYTGTENSNLLVEDGLFRCFFSADVYTKNIPYTVKVDLGYQNLSRTYISREISRNISRADEFKSIFVGVEAAYTLNSALKFFLGGEMPVYSWAVRPMKDPPDNAMLFNARAGVVWTFGESGGGDNAEE